MPYHLKTRIAVSVSALIIGLLAIIGWVAMSYFEKELEAVAFVHLGDLVELSIEEVEEEFDIACKALISVGEKVKPEHMAYPARANALLSSQTTAHLVFDNGLYLYDPRGTIIASFPWQEELIGQDFSDREYFRAAVKSRQPFVSDAIRSRQNDQQPVLVISEPILNATGELVAVLGGSLDLRGENFIGRMRSEVVGEKGEYLLVDRQGDVVIHRNRQQILQPVERMLPGAFAEPSGTRNPSAPSDPELKHFHSRLGGEEVLGVYRTIPDLGWKLVVLTPTQVIFGAVHEARNFLVGVLALLALLTIFSVRLLTNRLTSPLVALAKKVRVHLDNPQVFNQLPAEGFEELGELAESIQGLMSNVARNSQMLNDQLTFLQNLIDTIPGPIFYKDAELRYIGCNRAFEGYIGKSREELVGKTTFDIAPPELAEVYHKADLELWEQRGEQIYEARVQYADDSIHDVIFFKKIYADSAGNPAGMIGTFLDITDRKKSEQELVQALAEAEAAREQVDNILSSAADGVVVTNRRNRVTHINQIALDMLGVEREGVLNRPFTRLFQGAELRRQAKKFLALSDPDSRQYDFSLLQPGRSYPKVIQAISSTLQAKNGERTGVVTLLRDVSRIRELDQIKSEFISTAAHEMRTPMSIILGYCEILMNSEEYGEFNKAQQKEFLAEVYRKSEALSRLVDDLFDVSRIEAGLPLPLQLGHCDLAGIVTEVVRHYEAHSPNHLFKMSLTGHEEFWADCNKMNQVFDNLISNAVKYSPDGGTIFVEIAPCDSRLNVRIVDQGIGMSGEQLERVFDKFYRVDSTDTAIGGLGMGMSIVKAIIEAHGGRIRVESVLGQGTSVDISLPLTEEAPSFPTS